MPCEGCLINPLKTQCLVTANIYAYTRQSVDLGSLSGEPLCQAAGHLSWGWLQAVVQVCSLCLHPCNVLWGEGMCNLSVRGTGIMVTKDVLAFIVRNYPRLSFVRIIYVYPLPYDFAMPSTRVNGGYFSALWLLGLAVLFSLSMACGQKS